MTSFDCSAVVPGFEVDAVEARLAEALGGKPDGYWRQLATDVLEDARDARLAELAAVIERDAPPKRMTMTDALGQGRN
jgi:hypothetical protein